MQINIAENAPKDTHCYECSVYSFSVLVSSRCRSYACIEHSIHLFFVCIFHLHFGTNLLNFWTILVQIFPQNCLAKALFIVLSLSLSLSEEEDKEDEKTRCLNPAAGARDRRITVIKK